MQAWGQNYVQGIQFLGGHMGTDTLASLKTAKGKGDVNSFAVEPDDRVVGVYGYLD